MLKVPVRRRFSAAVSLIVIAGTLFIASCSDDVEPRGEQGDRDEFTIELVQRALMRYDDEGREATLSYYNSPESVEGEWYVFIIDEDDKLIAHRDPDLLGEDVKGDLAVDVTGYRFGDLMLGATEEGRWVDYLYLNPTTGNQEFKHSWVKRHDGLIFGSGWYQVLPTSPLIPSKGDPAEYTVAFVDRAIRYYKAHGRDAAVEYFNTPESVDGEWYVFIIDENDKAIANRDQNLLGQDLKGDLGVDVTGYRFGDLMLGATEEGRWVDYTFLNPTTGNQESKHSWVVRHDGIIIGSGWYE